MNALIKMLFAVLLGCFFLNVGLYIIGQILISYVYQPQNLKTKYNATWALVTGGSSGIGKSLAWKLAAQGLNLVIVALPEPMLDATTADLESAFPEIQIRKVICCHAEKRSMSAAQVGVDLSGNNYLNTIAKATEDIDVQIIFCNAGYLVTGFFHTTTMKQQLDNLDCNVTCAVAITHQFLSKMVHFCMHLEVLQSAVPAKMAKKLRGCFVYTSSPAGAMPGPFSALYASTKSFLSMFGASIAAEVKSHGVDVLVFHPSPIASRFYDNQKKIDMLDFFKRFAASPETLPDQVIRCIGRTVWADLGSTAMIFRILTKLVDFNSLATLLANIAHLMPDYKRHNRQTQTS